MRASILLSIAALFLSISTLAAVEQKHTGAGLGYILFKDQEGTIFEILAITTNGTSFNNTFAVMSGTWGAEKSDLQSNNKRVRDFVEHNFDALAIDIAAGSGESVDALIDLAAVPAEDRAAARAKLRAEFSSIYPSAEVSVDEVVASITDVLS